MRRVPGNQAERAISEHFRDRDEGPWIAQFSREQKEKEEDSPAFSCPPWSFGDVDCFPSLWLVLLMDENSRPNAELSDLPDQRRRRWHRALFLLVLSAAAAIFLD